MAGSKLHYLGWVPGQYFGGCESYAVRIAKRLHQQGWQVTIVCSYEKCFEAVQNRLDGVKVELVPSPVSAQLRFLNLRAKFTLLRLRWLYRQLFREHRPDVVHAILPSHYHSEVFLQTCDRVHVPCLVTFQLVVANFPAPKRYKRLYSDLASRLTRYCAISQNNRQLIHEYYDIDIDQIYCIPNRPEKVESQYGIEDIRKQILCSIQSAQKDIIVLTVGALVYQKGYDLTIEATPQIVKRYPNVLFCFAGDGPLHENLAKQAEKLGVSGHIKFLGQRDDVSSLLKGADFFLFPTRFEGGESLALLEAAQSCVPIVASRASGIPETFRDKVDALLFDTEDVDGLVRQMLAALDDPRAAQVRAESAMKRVAEYNEENMFEDTSALLKRVALC